MTSDSLLALNAGSSSIKFRMFDAEALAPIFWGQIDGIGRGLQANLTVTRADGAAHDGLPEPAGSIDGHDGAIAFLLDHVIVPFASKCVAVGHRIVHGGTRFAAPALVDDDVLSALHDLIPMARSHQPHNLAGLEAARSRMPDAAQVACFDTAFHQTVPEHRQLFAIPRALGDRGIRRYGFHGLSYEAIAEQLPQALGNTGQGRVVVLHLGNGSSACGLLGGASQATSMGFTPLDGLMMGNRPGHIDAGVILYLLREEGLSPPDISDMLYRKSGLLGVSGLSSDMRVLQASDDPAAKLAITMYVDRVIQEVGLTAAALGGIDALIFTAGIGENADAIRAATLDGLDWLGFTLDPEANATHGPRITTPGSDKPALVLKTDEEGVIARETARIVGLGAA